jgi:hypothetical protein
MDFGVLPYVKSIVGAIKSPASATDIEKMVTTYRPPYSKLKGFKKLVVREALNKIAHANPRRDASGFFVDDHTHDLLLSGLKGSNLWAAVISVPDLCAAIAALPDVPTNPTDQP